MPKNMIATITKMFFLCNVLLSLTGDILKTNRKNYRISVKEKKISWKKQIPEKFVKYRQNNKWTRKEGSTTSMPLLTGEGSTCRNDNKTCQVVNHDHYHHLHRWSFLLSKSFDDEFSLWHLKKGNTEVDCFRFFSY